MESLKCPNCSGAITSSSGSNCSHCGHQIPISFQKEFLEIRRIQAETDKIDLPVNRIRIAEDFKQAAKAQRGYTQCPRCSTVIEISTHGNGHCCYCHIRDYEATSNMVRFKFLIGLAVLLLLAAIIIDGSLNGWKHEFYWQELLLYIPCYLMLLIVGITEFYTYRIRKSFRIEECNVYLEAVKQRRQIAMAEGISNV